MRTRHVIAGLPALLFFAALPAHAYIGPGAGAGTIAVVLGILAAIVMAFFAILWYPVKRLFKKRKTPPPPKKPEPVAPEGHESP